MNMLKKLLFGTALLAGCYKPSPTILEYEFASAIAVIDTDVKEDFSEEYRLQKGSDYFLAMYELRTDHASFICNSSRIEKTGKYQRDCILIYEGLGPTIFDHGCDAHVETVMFDGITLAFKPKDDSSARKKANLILGSYLTRFGIKGKIDEFIKSPEATLKKSTHVIGTKEKAEERLEEILKDP